ncbi:hypothetical protein V8E36_007680 [Tilletia maclaganii]
MPTSASDEFASPGGYTSFDSSCSPYQAPDTVSTSTNPIFTSTINTANPAAAHRGSPGSVSTATEYTTPGWMMMNLAGGALIAGCPIVFHDGSPLETRLVPLGARRRPQDHCLWHERILPLRPPKVRLPTARPLPFFTHSLLPSATLRPATPTTMTHLPQLSILHPPMCLIRDTASHELQAA